MKRFISVICLVCLIFSCNIRNTRKLPAVLGSGVAQFHDSTSVQMIDSAYNFGNVTDGEKVEYSYRFRNTGKNPLIISSAVASCGCTVPEKPEKPIQPGDTGFLKVVFNSQGRVGEAHKTITVVSNAFPNFPELQLTGQVVAAKNN
jgi:hypothetical protein